MKRRGSGYYERFNLNLDGMAGDAYNEAVDKLEELIGRVPTTGSRKVSNSVAVRMVMRSFIDHPPSVEWIWNQLEKIKYESIESRRSKRRQRVEEADRVTVERLKPKSHEHTTESEEDEFNQRPRVV